MNSLHTFARLTDPNHHPRVEDWAALDVDRLDKELRTLPPRSVEEAGAERALRIFHRAAERVPAYKDFLRKHKIDHKKIVTIGDFRQVPTTSKKNYIERYPLKDRLWHGGAPSLYAASSGTTGDPVLWPRGWHQEAEAAVVHELYFHHLFGIAPKDRALIGIGFPMGIYVSGMATTLPAHLLTAKGYQYTLISAGLAKDRLLHVIAGEAWKGQKILLVGHPFMIKDLAESGKKAGIRWKNYAVRVMTCSEGFSEDWRNYVMNLLSIGDPALILNTYGSSEFLLMATETKFTVALRRALGKDPALLGRLFGTPDVLPQLYQFNPLSRWIEEEDGALIHTAASGVPLVRYDIEDRGSVLSYDVLRAALPVDVGRVAHAAWKLPVVGLLGRKGNAILYYGIIVYAEHLRAAFDSSAVMLKNCTGKFFMKTVMSRTMDPILEVNIELRPDVAPHESWRERFAEEIDRALRSQSIEYRFLLASGKKVHPPRVILWPYQDKKYFKPGMKPKFVA